MTRYQPFLITSHYLESEEVHQTVIRETPRKLSYQEEIGSKIKESSTDTSDLVPKRDIGLNSVSKVNSVRTQWREADIPECFFVPSTQPDKIKFSKSVKPKNKFREVGLSTDLSFSPNADIVISSQPTSMENNQEDRETED